MEDPGICQNQIRKLMQESKELLSPEFVPTSTTLLFGGN
jgi:hypothetical protein